MYAIRSYYGLALEWLHRLLTNPRRHFQRVFVESLPLVGLVVADRLKKAFGQ